MKVRICESVKARFMEEISELNTGIIILAAGSSSRLGEPKQLIHFNGKTLLEKTIQAAIDSECKDISVVLGANSEDILNEVKHFPVQFCVNEDWQSGMSSSLQIGLIHLVNNDRETDAIIVLVCDQPFIESRHINLIIEKFRRTKKPIIASKYKETNGVPALFAKEIFDKLMLIKGDKGARKIIDDFPELVETINIPEAAFDIDTAEDVAELREYFESGKL